MNNKIVVLLMLLFTAGIAFAAEDWNLAGTSTFTGVSITDMNVSGNITGLVANESYSYLIWTDGTNYYAKNGSSGKVDYRGTNASLVIQNAYDALPDYTDAIREGGGSIIFKSGNFYLPVPIAIKSLDHGVIIRGQGKGTLFYPTSYAFDVGSITGENFTFGAQFSDFEMSGGNGIRFYTGDRIVIRNINSVYQEIVFNLRPNLTGTEVNAITIQDSHLLNFKYGIIADTVNQMIIERNTISQSSTYSSDGRAIWFKNSSFGNTIRNNVFEQNGRSIQFDDGMSNKIYDNQFTSTQYDYAIVMAGTTNQIYDNYFSSLGAGVTAIYIPAGAIAKVYDNDFRGTIAGSIFMDGYLNGNTGQRVGSHFSGNSFGGIGGVIQDDAILRMASSLGSIMINVNNAQNIIWTFAEGSGTKINDISGSLISGTTINTQTWGTIPSTGWGKMKLIAANYDGIVSPHTGVDLIIKAEGNQTWIIVMSLNATLPDNNARALFWWEVSSATYINITKTASDAVSFSYTIGGITNTATSSASIIENIPMIFIGTYNKTSSVGTLYMNGRNMSSFTSDSPSSSNVGKMFIGRTPSNTELWNGDVMFFAKLNRVMDLQEVETTSKTLATLVGTEIIIPLSLSQCPIALPSNGTMCLNFTTGAQNNYFNGLWRHTNGTKII